MINKFIIESNDYLVKNISGYYHQLYTGYKTKGNPDFLNTLKNTFNTESHMNLVEARETVKDILIHDLPLVMEGSRMANCLCVCVPRAKALGSYSDSQLLFKSAVKLAANKIKGVTDGTDCVQRFKNTFTTHLGKATKQGKVTNDGDEPYPGITSDTCKIDKRRITNQNIILIDDIYTKSINIDEDCIQVLIDNGANKIVFYSIGFTWRE